MSADLAALCQAPQGRDSTHPSYRNTARWLARRLQSSGLKPAGTGAQGLGRYLQSFQWDQRFTSGRATSQNVIGVHRGDGTTNEAILVFAHLDGLSAAQKRGIETKARQQGKSVDMSRYQGANDNASAVAAALYVSDAIGRLQRMRGKRLKRDVVFVFPSAEEEGLKGTEAFARFSKQFPGKRFVAAVNFEMVGRGDLSQVRLFGGTSGFAAQRNPVYKRALSIKPRGRMAHVVPGHPRDEGQRWFTRSDHYVTHLAGIPSVMYLGQSGDYHTPKDSLQNIDVATNKGVARHALRLVVGLANQSDAFAKGRNLPAPPVTTGYPGQVYPAQ